MTLRLNCPKWCTFHTIMLIVPTNNHDIIIIRCIYYQELVSRRKAKRDGGVYICVPDIATVRMA